MVPCDGIEMFNMTCIAVHVKRNVYCWTLSSRCEDKREKILMIKTIFEDCQSRVRFVDDVFILWGPSEMRIDGGGGDDCGGGGGGGGGGGCGVMIVMVVVVFTVSE